MRYTITQIGPAVLDWYNYQRVTVPNYLFFKSRVGKLLPYLHIISTYNIFDTGYFFIIVEQNIDSGFRVCSNRTRHSTKYYLRRKYKKLSYSVFDTYTSKIQIKNTIISIFITLFLRWNFFKIIAVTILLIWQLSLYDLNFNNWYRQELALDRECADF